MSRDIGCSSARSGQLNHSILPQSMLMNAMKFRLRTLLLLVFVASLLSLLLRSRIVNRPIRFQSYSSQSLEKNLDEGRPVLVSIGADWCLSGAVNRDMISGKMGYPMRKNRVVALEADWTKPSQEVQTLMEELGVQTVPAIAIFTPATRKNPTIMTDLVDQERILHAIEQTNRQSDRTKD